MCKRLCSLYRGGDLDVNRQSSVAVDRPSEAQPCTHSIGCLATTTTPRSLGRPAKSHVTRPARVESLLTWQVARAMVFSAADGASRTRRSHRFVPAADSRNRVCGLT